MMKFVILTVVLLGGSAMGASVAAEAEILPVVEEPEINDLIVPEYDAFEGRTIASWGRSVMAWLGFNDYDYYDYEDDYYVPFESNHIGGGFNEPVSSYSHYQPSRDDTINYYDTDETSWGDMMFGFASLIIPLTVLLSAAMPAGVFTLALRRRSFDDDSWANVIPVDGDHYPTIRALQMYDFMEFLPELTTRSCQKKIFCELSGIGSEDSSSFLQKSFYYASTLTPSVISRRFGLDKLFETTRDNRCDLYSCSIADLQTYHYEEYDTNNVNDSLPQQDKTQQTDDIKEEKETKQ